MARRSSFLAFLLLVGAIDPVLAGITFLDPIPYLSAADSPFDMSGLGSTFFLEDFEDGVWDLPAGVEAGPYVIGTPSPFTDSVDGDDGVIDGWGTNGHSMWPNFHSHNFLGPPTWTTSFQMNFDTNLIVPNSFGLAWTDGVPGSGLTIYVWDDLGNRLPAREYILEMDPLHTGGSAFDRFVGFVSDEQIGTIVVNYAYRAWVPMYHFEADHVQFGLAPIPEPGALGLLMPTALLFWVIRKSRLKTVG
jgi:hypothetical protein